MISTNNFKIAGRYRVDHWKKLRDKLPINDDSDNICWEKAFKLFELRVKTRFLNPINKILEMYPTIGKGEGFSAVALQCILIEFFEAFYQGKIYAVPKDDGWLKKHAKKFNVDLVTLENFTQPNEYKSSASLFKSFFENRKPFDNIDKKVSGKFFGSFRCGLLHEAATKSSAFIRTKQKEDISILMEKDCSGNIILYRTPFQAALTHHLKNYGEELKSSVTLKKSFIRKMDELCQLERVYYFAYGSNLNQQQMKDRSVFFHESHKGFINDYSLKFNKKSKDGSSKANIIKTRCEKVWGVCYEIDKDGWEKLIGCEKGYEIAEVVVYNENLKMLVIAKTFISISTCKELPTKKYLDIIIDGAKQNELPEDYIQKLEIQKFMP